MRFLFSCQLLNDLREFANLKNITFLLLRDRLLFAKVRLSGSAELGETVINALLGAILVNLTRYCKLIDSFIRYTLVKEFDFVSEVLGVVVHFSLRL